MERLSINEVIEHCKRHTERIESHSGRSQLEETPVGNSNFMKQYWEHRQVAEWLEQLKSYKDLEERGLLLRSPVTVSDLIDKLFSRNETVALWYEMNLSVKKCFWRGMAWNIPEEYKKREFVKIFGTIPMQITQADTINIIVKHEAEQALARMEGGNE